MERRLAAILSADVVGYSRLIRADEEGTIVALKNLRADLIDPKLANHNGRIVKLMGDGMLVEFPSVVDAVRAAVEVQQAISERNATLPEEKRMHFRVGINLGDVVIDGDDIHGDGVNVAARLEGLAEPGGICISGAVYDQVRDRVAIAFTDLGEQSVKNIDRPVRTWHWHTATKSGRPVGRALPLPDKPSIAVLPFDNMSGDPEQDYFADGITEDIITALSRIRWFFVIARNSTFTFKGKSVGVQSVARDLGVRYVLEGSVRRVGNRVRITTQLIDGSNGSHLWAERYDRDLEDIFALQDEITETVVGAIGPEVTEAEIERAKSKRPENLDAWDLCMRSRAQLYLYTREGVAEAVTLSLRAIEMDASMARAHADVAFGYSRQLLLNYVEDRETVQELLMKAATRGVALDKQDAESHATLGLALWGTGEADEAITVLKRAIELGPSFAFAHSTLGLVLGTSGHAEEALGHHQMAIRLSPRDPQLAVFMSRYANSCISARRYEQAVELSKRAIRQSGGDIWLTFVEAATALAHLGRIDEARDMVMRMKSVQPNASVSAVRNAFNFKHLESEKHYLDGLRLAGLLE